LARQGKLDDAFAAYRQAIGIKPDYAELAGAFDDLCTAYLAVGKPVLAIQAADRALELEETEWRKMVFAHSAKSVTFSAEDARLRKLLLRALSEGWARPRNLAHVCVSLVTLSAVIKEAIARVQAAWPQRLGGVNYWVQPGLQSSRATNSCAASSKPIPLPTSASSGCWPIYAMRC
jgi:tetratricopeptide (TPR) repeat protein